MRALLFWCAAGLLIALLIAGVAWVTWIQWQPKCGESCKSEKGGVWAYEYSPIVCEE